MTKVHLVLCGIVLAFTPDAKADTIIEGRALTREYNLLKHDPEIVVYLKKDRRAALTIKGLERQVQKSQAKYRALREAADTARRRRAGAMAAQAPTQHPSRLGQARGMQSNEPEMLELRVAEAREDARDAFIELVAAYRRLKIAFEDPKASTAQSPTNRSPNRNVRQETRGPAI